MWSVAGIEPNTGKGTGNDPLVPYLWLKRMTRERGEKKK